MVSERKKETQYTWQTLWLIVGPRLPTDEVRIKDNIVLAKFSDENFENLKNSEAPVPQATPTTDNFVVRYPPRDVVQSRYKLQVDVVDEDQDNAIDNASKVVNRLLLSLSLSVDTGRYCAELRKIRRADQKVEYSAWSQSISVSIREEPIPLKPGDLAQTLKIFDAVQKDEIAENACVHLLTAWQLQDTAGAKSLERSVLQHYVLCIEAIVNGIMKNIRLKRKDEIRLEERQFAKEFAKELPNRADKAEAIRTASTRLREIALQNVLPSIDMVASNLKISDEIKEKAKEMYRFRSSRLSHPGRTTYIDFKKWLHSGPDVAEICLADLVARAFLHGYCAHRREDI